MTDISQSQKLYVDSTDALMCCLVDKVKVTRGCVAAVNAVKVLSGFRILVGPDQTDKGLSKNGLFFFSFFLSFIY